MCRWISIWRAFSSGPIFEFFHTIAPLQSSGSSGFPRSCGLGLMDEQQTLGGIEFAIRASIVVSA